MTVSLRKNIDMTSIKDLFPFIFILHLFFLNYILQVCLKKILKLQLTVRFCNYGIFWHNVLIFLDNSSLNRLWNGRFNLLLSFTFFFFNVAVCKIKPAYISLHNPRYYSK